MKELEKIADSIIRFLADGWGIKMSPDFRERLIKSFCESNGEDEDRAILQIIKRDLREYHLELDERRHGTVAMGDFIWKLESLLEMPYIQGKAKAAQQSEEERIKYIMRQTQRSDTPTRE